MKSEWLNIPWCGTMIVKVEKECDLCLTVYIDVTVMPRPFPRVAYRVPSPVSACYDQFKRTKLFYYLCFFSSKKETTYLSTSALFVCLLNLGSSALCD